MTQTLRALATDNALTQWITAGAILVAGVIVVTLLRRRSLVLGFFKRRIERGDAVFAPFVVDQYLHTLIPSLYALVLYAALSSLVVTPGLRHTLNLVEGAIVVFGIFRLLVALTVFSIDRHVETRENERPGSGRSISALIPIVQMVLWATGAVFLLENFGFRVDAIITGLGIGGVAVALAAQSLLKDVFGYVAIVLDRPFEIGDVIQTDAFIGTVEYIGLKTTHVRSLDGEQLIFANSDLTGSRIRNWKRMAERRVVLQFTLSGNTPSAAVATVPKIIRAAVEAQRETRFERAHFSGFAGNGLTFEGVYYVLSPEYAAFMDCQQAVNLTIKSDLDQLSIAFASNVVVVRDGAADGGAAPAQADGGADSAIAAGLGVMTAARSAETPRPA